MTRTATRTWEAEQAAEGWVHVTAWTVGPDDMGRPCIWLHRGPDDDAPRCFQRMNAAGVVDVGDSTGPVVPWPFGTSAYAAALTKLFDLWEATR